MAEKSEESGLSFIDRYICDVNACLTNAYGVVGGEKTSLAGAMKVLLDATREASAAKRRFFFIGNGASATMAEHFTFDFMKNGGLRTLCCSDAAYLTAVANDSRFEELFLLRLDRIGEEKDLLVAISSSGNSPNVVQAVEFAKKRGMYCVTFSAMGENNRILQMGDLNLYAPAKTYGLAESAHAVLLHGWLDAYLETLK